VVENILKYRKVSKAVVLYNKPIKGKTRKLYSRLFSQRGRLSLGMGLNL
jgi:hypothetical protein